MVSCGVVCGRFIHFLNNKGFFGTDDQFNYIKKPKFAFRGNSIPVEKFITDTEYIIQWSKAEEAKKTDVRSRVIHRMLSKRRATTVHVNGKIGGY